MDKLTEKMRFSFFLHFGSTQWTNAPLLPNRFGDSTSSLRWIAFFFYLFVDFITNDWSLLVLWFLVFPPWALTYTNNFYLYILRNEMLENLRTFLMFNLLLAFRPIVCRLYFCQWCHHYFLHCCCCCWLLYPHTRRLYRANMWKGGGGGKKKNIMWD